ncbi:hypothetical protein WJX84_011232 [Apatococcus fuscideae]|uniref:Glycoside hydrolase family 5 domain-containing protein n=1 Tax=Apatococcus fuscideae TaxID=2026836 RepID=A0AAW1T494_9CHLO
MVQGKCNTFLPDDWTFNRLVYAVESLTNAGFYVLLDNQFRHDNTVLERTSNWVQSWVKLITAISADGVAQARTMVDILNEPDWMNLRWEASDGKPGAGDLYLQAMDALYSVNPGLLFFIEDRQVSDSLAKCLDAKLVSMAFPYSAVGSSIAAVDYLVAWSPFSVSGLSDPTTFFRELFGKPYLDRTIMAPRINPPSVTGTTANSTGEALWTSLDTGFGYLSQQGFCYDDFCRVFPIAMAESGSNFTTAADLHMMFDLSSYMSNSGSASTGNHAIIGSWFWATWPPNRPIVGGIQTDDADEIQWGKINYLAELGLTPCRPVSTVLPRGLNLRQTLAPQQT